MLVDESNAFRLSNRGGFILIIDCFLMKFSIEHIYHFQCDLCEAWFTVGDFHLRKTKVNKIYCPFCGNVHEFEEISL